MTPIKANSMLDVTGTLGWIYCERFTTELMMSIVKCIFLVQRDGRCGQIDDISHGGAGVYRPKATLAKRRKDET